MVDWQQNWRRAEEELEEVNRRSNRGGSLSRHTGGCLFFPIVETKTGLNLQLNPWPAFDLVSGTGGGGQRAGRRGGSGCKTGACCCFEVPPRIWKRPIKQDYKSGATFLFELSIHTSIPQKARTVSSCWHQFLQKSIRSSNVKTQLKFGRWMTKQRTVGCLYWPLSLFLNRSELITQTGRTITNLHSCCLCAHLESSSRCYKSISS